MACHLSAREASWRRSFDPCTPLLVDLYHYLEQNGCFGLVPENPILIDLGSILVDGFDTHLIPWSSTPTLFHAPYSMKLFVRSVFKKNSAWPVVCQTEGLAKMMCESYQTYENNRGKRNRWHAMSKVTPVKIEVNTKQMAYHLFFFQKISLLDL